MKEYFKVKNIDVPLYGGKLVIILTNDINKLTNYIPRFNRDGIWAHSLYIDYKGKHGYTIILNFSDKNIPITHGTITHEALHISSIIADIVGIKADFNNDEAVAYIADWITDEVYKFINKEKFKVK